MEIPVRRIRRVAQGAGGSKGGSPWKVKRGYFMYKVFRRRTEGKVFEFMKNLPKLINLPGR